MTAMKNPKFILVRNIKMIANPNQTIRPDQKFAEDLEFSTSEFNFLLNRLEDQLEIKLDDNRLNKHKTVGELLRFCETLVRTEGQA